MTTAVPASAFQPLRIASKAPLEDDMRYSYFYNGEVIYSYCHQAPFQLTRLTELQFSQLKPKPFGIADKQHVVIADSVLPQSPRRCKRIGKHAHFYFVINKQIYRLHATTRTLQPIKQADAATFKVVDELIAEDDAHVFLKGRETAIVKSELGQYQVGNFEPLLLRGEHRLWLAGGFLEVDAKTTTFSGTINHFSELWVLKGEDEAGTFSIVYCRQRRQAQVLRGKQQQQHLIELNQQATAKKNAIKAMQLPLTLADNATDRWQQLRQWFTEDFSEKWQRYGDDERFYSLLHDCLSSCRQACQQLPKQQSVTAITQALAIYQQFFEHAGHACHFLVPSVLAQVIWLYAQQGDAEQLVTACQRAAQFELEALLTQREQIEQCHGLSAQQRACIQEHIDFHQQHPQAVSVALFDYHEQLCQSLSINDECGRSLLDQVRARLSYNYHHFSEAEINRYLDNGNAEQQNYWRRLKQRTADYFKRYMLLDCPYSLVTPAGQRWLDCFQRYAEHAYLNPLAFICVADQLFRHAHHWAEWREQHFTDVSQGTPLKSRKLAQSQALFAHFEQYLQRLDDHAQQCYRQQAMAYSSYRLLHPAAENRIK